MFYCPTPRSKNFLQRKNTHFLAFIQTHLAGKQKREREREKQREKERERDGEQAKRDKSYIQLQLGRALYLGLELHSIMWLGKVINIFYLPNAE
jgi:hypothetical protein